MLIILGAVPKTESAQRSGKEGLSNFSSDCTYSLANAVSLASGRDYLSSPQRHPTGHGVQRYPRGQRYPGVQRYPGGQRYPGVFRYRPRAIVSRPIIVGGFYPYYWYPYLPFFDWGFGWYPIGTIVGGIAATAIIVGTIEANADNTNNPNNRTNANPSNKTDVYYDNGTFYQQEGKHYRVITAPIGMVVPNAPEGATQCAVNNTTYYYFGGVFYQKVDSGYEIVRAPNSAIVFNLPPGANEVVINDKTYYDLNGVYFQPITYENEPAFQVVEHP
jgi:hypothetical protein